MTTQDKAQQAEVFAQDWAEKGDEKQHTQSFWITFLRDVVGVFVGDNPRCIVNPISQHQKDIQRPNEISHCLI